MTDQKLITKLSELGQYIADNEWLHMAIGNGAYERAASDRLEELTETSAWTEGQNMPQYPRIRYKYGEHYCLKCGEKALVDNLEKEEYLTNYCPFCGKEMVDASL